MRPLEEVLEPSLPAWLGRSKLSLFYDVIGGPRQNYHKLKNVFSLLYNISFSKEPERRLERLKDLGHIDVIPTQSQMIVSAYDQIMYTATEDTRLFYKRQQIPWNFHILRRIISDPSTLMDPIGIYSPRDTIINHILQTYHRHPVYDLVLLRAHKNGIEELEKQLDKILTGKHIHQKALTSLMEDDNAYERLYWQVKEFKQNPYLSPLPLKEGLAKDPILMIAMAQFTDLRGFTNYASRVSAFRKDVLKVLGATIYNGTFGKITGPWNVATFRLDCCDNAIVKKYIHYAKP